MANRSEYNALVQRHVISRIPDEIFLGAPYWAFMLKSGRVVETDQDSSQPILHTDPNLAKAYDGMDDIEPQVPPDIISDADYPLSHWSYPLMLPWTKVRASRGPASAKNLLQLHQDSAGLSIAEKMGNQMWTDQDASVTTLLGIPRILSTTTSAEVGGLDTDAKAAWAPVRANGGGDALARADLENAIIEATYGNDGPKLGLMEKEVAKKTVALFTSNERFLDHDALKAGFTSVTVMGVPHFIDDLATATTINYLNTRFLEIAYDPEDWFSAREIGDNWVKQRVLGFQIFWSLQHRCSSRRRQAIVNNFT